MEMEMLTVVGVEKLDYTSKRSGKQVKGITIHAAYEKKGVEGMACVSQYVSEANVGDAVVKAGDQVGFYYNRFGSVESFTVEPKK